MRSPRWPNLLPEVTTSSIWKSNLEIWGIHMKHKSPKYWHRMTIQGLLNIIPFFAKHSPVFCITSFIDVDLGKGNVSFCCYQLVSNHPANLRITNHFGSLSLLLQRKMFLFAKLKFIFFVIPELCYKIKSDLRHWYERKLFEIFKSREPMDLSRFLWMWWRHAVLWSDEATPLKDSFINIPFVQTHATN